MMVMLYEILLRLVLLGFGVAAIGTEVWGTYDFLWDKYHHWNYLVLGGLVATSAAPFAPLAAAFAAKHGMPHKLRWGAWISVPLVISLVLYIGVDRTGGAVDQDEASRERTAQAIEIATQEQTEALEQLVVDRSTVKRNCTVWGPICDKAKAAQQSTENKLEAARAVLKKHVKTDDGAAKRFVALFPFLTKEQVQTYQPMLLPLGLSILGSVFVSVALAPSNSKPAPDRHRSEGWSRAPWRRRGSIETLEPEIIAPVAKPQKLARTDRQIATVPASGELDPTPVVSFLTRRLPVVRGAETDWAEIYGGFLAEWEQRGESGEPPSAAEFGHMLRYICEQANIRIERRGKAVVCLDRKLVA